MLLIASHNQPHHINDTLTALGYTVLVRQLRTADYVWDCPVGRVGCEVKQWGDLLNKAHTDEQLFRLQGEFAIPLLLLVGPMDATYDLDSWVRKQGWNFMSVDNMLVGRQLRGIVLARCPDMENLAERLHSLARYLARKPSEAPRPRYVPYIGPMSDRAEVVHALLRSVPRIKGKARIAERVAEAASLREVFVWDAARWQEFGLSKVMADRVVARLEEQD